MRKLLWTFGSDPEFESYENKNAIMISPSNFHRVCDALASHAHAPRPMRSSHRTASSGGL